MGNLFNFIFISIFDNDIEYWNNIFNCLKNYEDSISEYISSENENISNSARVIIQCIKLYFEWNHFRCYIYIYIKYQI